MATGCGCIHFHNFVLKRFNKSTFNEPNQKQFQLTGFNVVAIFNRDMIISPDYAEKTEDHREKHK